MGVSTRQYMLCCVVLLLCCVVLLLCCVVFCCVVLLHGLAPYLDVVPLFEGNDSAHLLNDTGEHHRTLVCSLCVVVVVDWICVVSCASGVCARCLGRVGVGSSSAKLNLAT